MVGIPSGLGGSFDFSLPIGGSFRPEAKLLTDTANAVTDDEGFEVSRAKPNGSFAQPDKRKSSAPHRVLNAPDAHAQHLGCLSLRVEELLNGKRRYWSLCCSFGIHLPFTDSFAPSANVRNSSVPSPAMADCAS